MLAHSFKISAVFIVIPFALLNAISFSVIGGTPQIRSDIENIIKDLTSRGLSIDLILDKITETLKNRGFLSPNIKVDADEISIEVGEEYRIDSIEIKAEEKSLSDLIRSIIGIGIDDIASISKIEDGVRKVISVLNLQGYYHPVVDYYLERVAGDRVILSIKVNSGYSCFIKDLRLSGITVFSEKMVINEMGLSDVRGAIKPSDISYAVSKIYRLYRDAGYGNCNVRPMITDIDEDGGLHLIIYINEGSLNLISKIFISGNNRTREVVILREIEFKPGDILRETDIKKTKSSISKLPFIKGTPEIIYEDGIVNIKVREGRAVLINGGLGVSPSSASSDLIGDVKFRMTNIAGTGRALLFSFSSWSENAQDISTSYTEPWVSGMPIDITGKFSLARRITYKKFVIEGAITGKLTGVLSLEGGGGFEKTARTLGAHTDDYYGFCGLIYNNIPSGKVPTTGSRANIRFDYGIRKVVGFGDNRKVYKHRPDIIAKVKWTGSIERYISAGIFVPYICLNWGMVHIGFGGLDDGDMFEVGGARSLRGYRRGAFFSDRFAIGTGEFHIMMSGRAYIYPLVDVGILHERKGVKTKVGYGVGLGADVGLGLLDISYTIGEGGLTNGMLNILMEMW
ncbi:MAG: POTRA domain-containing protein [bacterium]